MKIIRLLTGFILLCSCGLALAGNWTFIDPTSPQSDLGGLVRSVAFLDDGTAVMSSNRGYVYTRSSASDPWVRSAVQVNGQDEVIYRLITTPGAGGQILASTLAGLLSSSDSGATWQEIVPVVSSGFTLNRDQLSATSDPDIIYGTAGTLADPFGDTFNVLRSDDGGTTWQVLGNPSGLESYNNSIKYVESSATDPASVFAVTQNSGVYLSRDSGATWSLLSVDSGSGPVIANDATFSSGDENELYAHRNGRIYRSVDAGVTWSQSSYFGSVATGGMAADPNQPGVVYLYGRGILRYDGATNSSVTYTWGNAFDTAFSFAVSTSGDIITGSRRGVRIVDGPSSTGSSNLGFSDFNFDKIKIAPSNGGYLYGLNEYGGVAAYDPVAQHWKLRGDSVNATFKRDIDVSHQDPGRLVIATSFGVFTSSQAGLQWQDNTPADLPENNFSTVIYSPTDDLTLYSHSFPTNGVVRSLDGAQSWSTVLDGAIYGGCCFDFVSGISPVNDNHVIITATGGPVPAYLSIDGGESWDALSFPAGYETQTARAVHFDAVSTTTVQLVFYNAIATSTDLGESWSLHVIPTEPGPFFSIRESVVDPLEPSRLYMATTSHGLQVYDRRDNSVTALGLPPSTACLGCDNLDQALSADKTTAGRVLLSSSGVLFEYLDDRDNDGLLDQEDNCASIDNIDQIDSDADGIGNACDPDIAPATNDCTVNFLDLQAFAAAFLSEPGTDNWNADADFNNDLVVNFLDFTVITNSFFGAPGPSGSSTSCR